MRHSQLSVEKESIKNVKPSANIDRKLHNIQNNSIMEIKLQHR